MSAEDADRRLRVAEVSWHDQVATQMRQEEIRCRLWSAAASDDDPCYRASLLLRLSCWFWDHAELPNLLRDRAANDPDEAVGKTATELSEMWMVRDQSRTARAEAD